MLKYVFGPVYSGRLGRSLGVDLLGEKICSFDCLYCEVGKTKEKTFNRAPYVSSEDILKELEIWFKKNKVLPEIITLGGSGEPCLNLELGKIAREIKRRYSLPLALLTNSSLFFLEEIIKEVQVFDIILPSLDSLVEEEFEKINRPVKEVNLKKIKQGLTLLSDSFKGKIFLEILLLPGYNNSWQNLERLKEFIAKLRVDRVDVTTMTRPGSYLFKQVTKEELLKWNKELNILAVDMLKKQNISEEKKDVEIEEEVILSSLKRRPQTLQDLEKAFGVKENILEKKLNNLLLKKKIVVLKDKNKNFYKVK